MNPSALCILSTRDHYCCRFASEGWEVGFIYLIDTCIYVEEPVGIQFVVIFKVRCMTI